MPGDGDFRPDSGRLRWLLDGDADDRRNWLETAAIPTLQQMLQAENAPLRFLLVELLSEIKDPSASVVLAQRALYDLSADVRAAAIQALDHRPREEYRGVLLNGFRHPWPAVAEHAAEALAALKDKEATPALVKLLNQPAAGALFFDSKHQAYFVREMVRINHLSNCLLCHAPSTDRHDLVRAAMPDPRKPLPPPDRGGYSEGGIFIRADVTYLKQDFSVPQPVENPGEWPTMQRYDYLVRTRSATRSDHLQPVNKQREEAIRFALINLTKG
jgi:hypothetical protein